MNQQDMSVVWRVLVFIDERDGTGWDKRRRDEHCWMRARGRRRGSAKTRGDANRRHETSAVGHLWPPTGRGWAGTRGDGPGCEETRRDATRRASLDTRGRRRGGNGPRQEMGQACSEGQEGRDEDLTCKGGLVKLVYLSKHTFWQDQDLSLVLLVVAAVVESLVTSGHAA